MKFGLLTLVLAGAAVCAASSPARATGTVTVQQSDGSVRSYPHSTIKLLDKMLSITTADGKGTLVVNRAACSFQSNVLVCLPTSVTLVQNGHSDPLDLSQGTLYVNPTGEKQQLPFSSTQIPPHGLVLSFRTKIGTYVNLTGTIDKGVK